MAMQAANAAFVYVRTNYDTGGPALVGRQVATGGFLDAFVRHGGADKLYCYTPFKEDFDDFSARANASSGGPWPTVWIRPTALAAASDVGTLFRPGPDVGELAWLRRRFGERGVSLCGVTHATADGLAMDAIGNLLLAPVHPWDALVATSKAVKGMVERMLEGWGDYLGQKFRSTAKRGVRRAQTAARIPVIPLGIDCARFEPAPGSTKARGDFRAHLGIADGTIVVLYLGRLSHTDKANPFPLYLSLEAAARTTERKVHLIEAGWFPDSYHEQTFRQAARTFTPTLGHSVVDGRDPQVQQTVRAAADVFASLPDNVQETFGLAPVEAMAAGLPCVVSDWNGYRETVRDGIDGIRVPTLMPPAGAGEDAAYWYASGISDTQSYLASVAQSVAVDVQKASEAFVALFLDESLRRRMGEAGRIRARAEFDWSVIVPRYQELWRELAQVRGVAKEPPPRGENQDFHPLRGDPYRLFQSYPTRVVEDSVSLARAPDGAAVRLERAWQSPLTMIVPNLLLSRDETAALLAPLAKGPATAGELVAALPAVRAGTARRTIGWLLKTGVLRLSE